MLSDKDRVPSPRRLLAVIDRRGRREALRDEILGMGHYCRQPAVRQVGAILFTETNAPAESRVPQRFEDGIEIAHPR